MKQAELKSIRFTPFCEHRPVRSYKSHHLPHIRQDGCTYFVTFRLADSVPTGRFNQWTQEKRNWLSARGIDDTCENWKDQFDRLDVSEQRTFERYFASRLFETLDEAHGECLLAGQRIRQVVVDALKHFDEIKYWLGDFVVMPNHVHVLMTPFESYELEQSLHSIKTWTSRKINETLGRKGKLWMTDSFDRLTRDSEELSKTQSYIRLNPLKAGLNEDEFYLGLADYTFSS